ncbi:MAG: DUF4365 domain-containing protein [Lachnospiraceae bacterium]|nr:DUF4365 domain-containing protein [Lachnospiraceae bacterium]
MDNQLQPTYSEKQQIGNRAASFLKTVVSNFASVNEIEGGIDFGIDMRAELTENEKPLGLFFNIQCKGKSKVDSKVKKSGYFSIQIKITTINYWRQQNDVTLLFVVDNVANRCYWCNPLEQIADRVIDIQEQESVTIKVFLDEYMDVNSKECPRSIRQSIMLYMADQLEHINDSIDKINKAIISGSGVDIETSIELLKRINKSTNTTLEKCESVCDSLLVNIKKQFSEAYNSALKLGILDQTIVKKYCKNDVRKERGFTKSGKSLCDLEIEINRLIHEYENNKRNLDLLEELKECDREVEEFLKNMLYFLYEMTCEDDPFGDHTEFFNKINEREWKYK